MGRFVGGESMTSNYQTDRRFTVDMDTITDEQAQDLFVRLSQQFGWGGTLFTRIDAERNWNTEEDGPFTDEVWQAITLTWCWRKGLDEVLCQEGWELVNEAISEVVADRSTKKVEA